MNRLATDFFLTDKMTYQMTSDYKQSARILLDFQWKDRMAELKQSKTKKEMKMLLDGIPVKGDANLKKDRQHFLHLLSLGYDEMYQSTGRCIKKCNIMWAIEYLFNTWDTIPEPFIRKWLKGEREAVGEENYCDICGAMEGEVVRFTYHSQSEDDQILVCPTCEGPWQTPENMRTCLAHGDCGKCKKEEEEEEEEEAIEVEEVKDFNQPSPRYLKWAAGLSKEQLADELVKREQGYDKEVLLEEEKGAMIGYFWDELKEDERVEWWE